MELFRLMGSILIEDKEALDALKRTDKAGESTGDKLKKMGGTAVKAFGALAIAAGAAAVAIGGKALKSAVDFEKQMANVATLLDGDVKGKMKNLGDEVKRLSTSTGASTDLLSEGLYQVVSAFGETEDSMKILETAAKGAAAGNATVTDSVNLLAAVTKGYGDTSSEAANKASDLAFLTVKLGQTSFPELASSMGKVIPLASTMKVSQEELFGAMATLTGVTGGTAEVTTQLRGAIQGFMQPSKQMEAALKDLGYENGQVALESEGLGGILESLKDSVGGNEIAFAGLFGSVEAKSAVLALTGAQADDFTAKTLAMKDAVGSTEAAFETQQATVSAMMDKMKASANVLFINLGEKLLPVFTEMLDWVMGKMPQIEATLTKAFDVIGTVVNTVKDYVLFFIDGLRGVGDPEALEGGSKIEAMIYNLGEVIRIVADFIKENMPAVKEFVSDAFTTVKEVVDEAKEAFITITDYIKEHWAIFEPILAGIVGAIVTYKLIAIAIGLWTAATKLWTVVTGIATGIGTAFAAVIAFITSPIGLLVIAIGLAIAIGVALYRNWDVISAKATELWSGIKDTFDKIKTSITDSINTAKDAVETAINKIKGFFDFKFEWPKLKMPTFSMSGSMNPIKWLTEGVPKLKVNWNAKGAIFDKPTIFNTPYGMQGVGEAGPEAVAPISKLQEYIRDAVGDAQGGNNDAILKDILKALRNMQIVMDTGELVGVVQGEMDFRTQQKLGGVGVV